MGTSKRVMMRRAGLAPGNFPLSAAAGAFAAVLLLATGAHAEPEAAVAAGPAVHDPLPGSAGSFSLKIETGLAFPLADPQAQRFEMGGSQTIKALWSLNDYFDIGPSATFLLLPSQDGSEGGTAGAFGGGARLKRPHQTPDDDAFYSISPWVDADALYVRTGELNRAGLAAAVGLAVPVGKKRIFWVGPFVRYMQLLQQPERDGFDNHDAKILSAGISLEVGSGVEREVAGPPPEIRTIREQVASCPDRDKDGIPDDIDQCPDVAGPMDSFGCPPQPKVTIKGDRLELREKIYFAWNAETIQEVSYPVLDEVVQALNDNQGFNVRVEGHASSEGTEQHNQELSEGRAEAVLDYLAAHGIAKERLGSKGFASSVPMDTNSTVAGRENNRRVEFVVHFVMITDGSNSK